MVLRIRITVSLKAQLQSLGYLLNRPYKMTLLNKISQCSFLFYLFAPQGLEFIFGFVSDGFLMILTIFAPAEVAAVDPCVEALAVFLFAASLFAMAAFGVDGGLSVVDYVDLRAEGQLLATRELGGDQFDEVLLRGQVLAVQALAEGVAGPSLLEAPAVQPQAVGLTATTGRELAGGGLDEVGEGLGSRR